MDAYSSSSTLPEQERREEASRIILQYLLDDSRDLVGALNDRDRKHVAEDLLSTSKDAPATDIFDKLQTQAKYSIENDIIRQWWVKRNGTSPWSWQ